ncbi:EAL domain-containing protein [Marinomonas algicola]|jgi:EAL domain-containing protein (putative c-di-GMP-specific phosphodiesterase class I)/GGDEF domain-containing protein|uniref:EAL domain-containing protein n=1 Tax=Marinomonas algicola TaxID=2773454 RepID=UPI00174DD175|nr:bifunctional diguanylate cyclase/phosphodiesterase [Marinomonas algicola]
MISRNWISRISGKMTDRVFALVMLVLYFLAITLFTYTSVQTREAEIKSSIKTTLFTAAISAEHLIGVEFGQHFSKDTPPNETIYRYIVNKLNKWVDTLPVSYVYLMDMVDGQVYFVISNETVEERKNGVFSEFYRPYDSAPESLLRSFVTQETIFSDVYENEYGTFQSIFVPVERKNGSVYVLAADISVEGGYSIIWKSIHKSLWLTLLFLLPLMPMMYFYFELQKQKRNDLWDSLYKDKLTALPNSYQLHNALKSNQTFFSGILISFMGIDDISLQFGRSIRDSLLVRLTQELNVLPPSYMTLYRIKGGEFFLLSDAIDESLLYLIVEDILYGINGRKVIEGNRLDLKEVIITANAGVVVKAQGHQLFQHAKDALSKTLDLGQPFFVFRNHKEQSKQLASDYFWQNEVAQALIENRVVPFFQPIFDNQKGRVERYEILVRLINKEGDIVTPHAFLDPIRHCYLYKHMTHCMIEKGCKAFANRTESITLNLCKSDLLDNETLDFLKNSIQQCNLDGRVTIEVVESDWIGNQHEIFAVLRSLRSVGLSIAIDDFGSGYSNFDQLLKMEVDYIKIDGSLIKSMFKSERAFSMVEAIIALAKGLNVPVIPEFVENQTMLSKLQELGCEFAQGYVTGRPIPVEELPKTN